MRQSVSIEKASFTLCLNFQSSNWFLAKNNCTISMVIKRCEIGGIAVDIKIEDRTSTKEE